MVMIIAPLSHPDHANRTNAMNGARRGFPIAITIHHSTYPKASHEQKDRPKCGSGRLEPGGKSKKKITGACQDS